VYRGSYPSVSSFLEHPLVVVGCAKEENPKNVVSFELMKNVCVSNHLDKIKHTMIEDVGVVLSSSI